MSDFRISLEWRNAAPDFAYESFDRTHRVRFGGGQEVNASSAPEYSGDAACVNPEESLAAALSSCHMLTFLALCAKKRLHVLSYTDEAVATLGKNEAGRLCVDRITLHPKAAFAAPVSDEQLHQLHERAHQACFIANSINCRVDIAPSQA